MSIIKNVIYTVYHQGEHLGDLYQTESGVTLRVTSRQGLEELTRNPAAGIVSLQTRDSSRIMGSKHFCDLYVNNLSTQVILPVQE